MGASMIAALFQAVTMLLVFRQSDGHGALRSAGTSRRSLRRRSAVAGGGDSGYVGTGTSDVVDAQNSRLSMYIIASFPSLGQVNYVRPPELAWLPLVDQELTLPKAIAVDELNTRLFIVDPGAEKIFWYQYHVVSDGSRKLATDGRQHIAASEISPRGVAVDSTGAVYFSGATLPPAPAVSRDAVFTLDAKEIAAGAERGVPVVPKEVWGVDVTEVSAAGLAVDSLNIFWGSRLGGTKTGSLLRGSRKVPEINAASKLFQMADNVDVVTDVAITSTAVFYTGQKRGIYGVQKNKVGRSCSEGGASCALISDEAESPTGLAWDGDGTMYVVATLASVAQGFAGVTDAAHQAVYAFTSGSVAPHALRKVIDAPHAWGLSLLSVNSENTDSRGHASCLASTSLPLALAVLSMSLGWNAMLRW